MTRQARTILIMATFAVAAVVLLGIVAGRYEKALASRRAAVAPAASAASPAR